jgi:cell division septum initiation protein DivIVA
MRRDMAGLGRRVGMNEPAKRRSRGPVIADEGHRFDGADRPGSATPPPRFPITRQGYDRAVVDQRFAELEQEVLELDRELAKVHASTALRSEADTEPERIGKQVSAVLIAAHESASEIRRVAEAEAQRRIADAESQARSITGDANRELRRLQDEMASLQRKHNQLFDDICRIADRLRALADKSSERPPQQNPSTIRVEAEHRA